jgi:hypothetical protein
VTFKTGQIPWNKGITPDYMIGNKFSAGSPAWNSGKKTGIVPSNSFRKGDMPWNKGLSMPEEVKTKISVSKKGQLKGIPRTEEIKRKISESKNRGLTPLNKLERGRFHREVFPNVLRRDNYTCQICDQVGGSLSVDHIRSWVAFPELRFEESNCRTLCMACHYYITFKRKLPQGVVWGHGLNKRIKS